jgi:hypothetical protein
MDKPTKYYSEIQEKYVANKLGWEQVVASGARDFHPGDVKSDDWIGECKTRAKFTDKIAIKRLWWDKLVSEANSMRKCPALFVDNGDVHNLWAVSYSTYGDIIYITNELPDKYVRKNISFKLDELKYDMIYHVSDWDYCFNKTVLMKFELFKEMYM